MSVEMETMPRYEKIQIVLIGIVLASALFSYGLYAFAQASCTLIGRGNPPIGTFVTFSGIEARLLSTIYLGAGLWLFSGSFLAKYQHTRAKVVSWIGASLLFFGICSLVVILCLPLFQ